MMQQRRRLQFFSTTTVARKLRGDIKRTVKTTPPKVYAGIAAKLVAPGFQASGVLPADGQAALARAQAAATARSAAIAAHIAATAAHPASKTPSAQRWAEAARAVEAQRRAALTERGSGEGDGKAARHRTARSRLLARLAAEGAGPVVATLRANVVHVDATRLVGLASAVRGLALADALATLRWTGTDANTNLAVRRLDATLTAAAVRAKDDYARANPNAHLDLARVFVADVFVRKDAAILSAQFTKRFLRGRGRYGAVQHPKTALLELVLQLRDRPFDKIQNDPLEWLRKRLRDRVAGRNSDPNVIYNNIVKTRVQKLIRMAKKGKKDKGVKTEAQLLKEEEARRKLIEENKAKAK
ncbi:hypothetical protein HK100_005505, partial [Physocladia obscura]